MSHLITTVSELEGRGAGLHALTEQIDTTTAGGRLISHIFGALGHDADTAVMRSPTSDAERAVAQSIDAA